jgi:hypothetical protein
MPYGGADFGEVWAVAEAIGDGDDAAYYDAWNTAGDRLTAEADKVLGKGHVASARALYLRASAFYATSFHPVYGAPVDPRLLAAFRKQVEALDAGFVLGLRLCSSGADSLPHHGAARLSHTGAGFREGSAAVDHLQQRL